MKQGHRWLETRAAWIRNIAPFREVLDRHVPGYREKLTEFPELTIRELAAGLPEDKLRSLEEELARAGEIFQKTMWDEVREFGVEADPSGPRTRWVAPEAFSCLLIGYW